MPYTLPAGVPAYLRALSRHFATGAEAAPVLRVLDSVPGGALTIGAFTLTLTPGAGSRATAVTCDLRGQTLATLVTTLAHAGFTTTPLDPTLAALSATILADQATTPFGGEALLGIATNPLWRLFNPVAQQEAEARADARAGVAQIDLRLASDRWLDALAALYGTRRHAGESDALLRSRVDFHAVRPHATVPALTTLIQEIGGVAATVVDGPVDFFRCGQHSARTLTARQRTPRKLPPGLRPLITVTLHETLAPDTAPYPVADEIGARFHPRCWAKAPTTHVMPVRSAFVGEGAMRLPAGPRGVARRFPDPSFRSMIPQRASRALWELIDTYKAAGVAHLLRLPHVVALSDRAPDELVLQNGALGQGQNSVPITGYVRAVTLTRYVPATPPTSRVVQVVVTTAVVTGPLRVTRSLTTAALVKERVGRAVPTSLHLAINALVASETAWPRERRVVRTGVWTTLRVLQRVMSRER